MFNEDSKLVISLLNQFLGLDTDRFVPEVLFSPLFKMSMCQSESKLSQLPCLKFDELLIENIQIPHLPGQDVSIFQ